jgi:hypothetical protein
MPGLDCWMGFWLLFFDVTLMDCPLCFFYHYICFPAVVFFKYAFLIVCNIICNYIYLQSNYIMVIIIIKVLILFSSHVTLTIITFFYLNIIKTSCHKLLLVILSHFICNSIMPLCCFRFIIIFIVKPHLINMHKLCIVVIPCITPKCIERYWKSTFFCIMNADKVVEATKCCRNLSLNI